MWVDSNSYSGDGVGMDVWGIQFLLVPGGQQAWQPWQTFHGL